MKLLFPLGCCLSLVLIGCSGSGESSKGGLYNPGMGPFDENGDYVEALADAPVRRNGFARKASKAKPESKLAQLKALPKKNPPQPQAQPQPQPQVQLPPRPQPQVLAQRQVQLQPQFQPQAQPQPQIQPQIQPRPQVLPQSQPQVIAQAESQVSPPAPPTQPRSTPAARPASPEPVLMKPSKPAPLKHLVTSSDTLYGLSRKYGVPVDAIQRANGLSGSTITTGRTLLIPR